MLATKLDSIKAPKVPGSGTKPSGGLSLGAGVTCNTLVLAPRKKAPVTVW